MLRACLMALVCCSACGGGDPAAPDGGAPDAPAATGPTEPVPAPDTPAGRRLAWVLGLLNGGPAGIDAAAVAPHFSRAFLWKSLPSGTLQREPADTKVSLVEMARKMIAISDNTGTDHLLHFAGRRQVEEAQAGLGHARPALNVPFLSTRELFVLKLIAGDDQRRGYLAAAPEERRRLPDEVFARTPLEVTAEQIRAWNSAREIERLEWFASPADVCRAWDGLRRRAQQSLELLEIVSLNPGLPVDRQRFPFVGFKGGSEPGVLTLSWLLRRADERWFVATLGLADPAAAVDEGAATYHALALTRLVGRLP